MPSASVVKLEERETRKMLTMARQAKKADAKKKAKGSKKAVAEEPKKRFKPKGAIILKSDLVDATDADTPSKKGGRKSQKGRASKGAAAGASSAPAAPANAVEPPFSFEVHHKNKQVIVHVTLHKVPPQSISVAATTKSTLVVETPTFTKKFYLAFDMPSGIVIDPTKAEYTFETGVLKCVMPIAGGIPKALQAARDKLIEKVKNQKTLRFRVSNDGDLVVRSRRALLKPTASSAAPATGKKAQESSAATVATTEATKTTKLSNPKKEAAPAAKQQRAAASGTGAPSASTKKSKQFVEDGKAMLAAAVSAGKAQRNQLYVKLEKARVLQGKRVERLSRRDVRKDSKREKDQATFARVIAEQKKQLVQRAELAKPVPPKNNAGAKAKNVSFAKA